MLAGVCPLNGDSSCFIQTGLSDASKIRSLALRGKQKSYAVCVCACVRVLARARGVCGEYLDDKLQEVAGKLRQLHTEELHPVLLEGIKRKECLKLEARKIVSKFRD